MSDGQYSDYIVFVDESGDHGLEAIDPCYPLFVLAFCILRKEDYVRQLTPAMQLVKFKHFGHDNFILHERDIRKDSGDFSSLKTREKKAAFMADLSAMVEATPFTMVCCIIRKDRLKHRYADPGNPYHIALGFGLEWVFYFLRSKGAVMGKTHVIVEKRGKREDAELELECRRVCDGENHERAMLPFEVVFLDKKSNSPGLQLADMVARPVGINLLKPEQQNRAYDVLRDKFYVDSDGNIQNWGLKCFP
ncbi:MAG: DUF3800 domain-containing protein [Gallionella sp.]|nr:DUF3800 domain-containing protein [Gallionella sp.]